VVAVPCVLAQNGNETTVVEPIEPTTPTEELLTAVGKILPSAFVIAFITSFLGYARKTKPENFELTKLMGTLLLSLLIGVVTTMTGWDYARAEVWAGNAGLTIWIYWLAHFIAIKMGWATSETKAEPSA